MYVNKELDIEWWLPPRTASRMTKIIIQKLGFECFEHHHYFDDNISGRKIIINVRNPYSIVVSRYKQFYKKNITGSYTYEWENFNDFVKTFISWVRDGRSYQFYTYPEIFNSTNASPFFKVRYESYIDDLMSLDFIRNNQHLITDELNQLHQGKWSENSLLDTTIPYNAYYDQESADMVYDLYNNIFIYDEYDRESWKTITI
jgi:hypothetical protein